MATNCPDPKKRAWKLKCTPYLFYESHCSFKMSSVMKVLQDGCHCVPKFAHLSNSAQTFH